MGMNFKLRATGLTFGLFETEHEKWAFLMILFSRKRVFLKHTIFLKKFIYFAKISLRI
jgi:hypothetical protein